jgi:mRNA interferase HicA
MLPLGAFKHRSPVEPRSDRQRAIGRLRRILREGSRHTVYVNRVELRSSTVPRHGEIPNNLARKICRDLGVSPP